MILVLSKEIKLDLSSPSKTACIIEGFTIRFGARVSARTIENHIKRIGIGVANPFESRERTTLSILITALAKERGLPLSKPASAASLIKAISQNYGDIIETGEIEEVLKRAHDALDKRPE